jgi:DNA invertase Pin-like site-specific DNA recombinase
MLDISNVQNLREKHINEYLVYTRKSTDDLDNQKNSIDYQVYECLRFSKKEGLTIAPIDIDGFCQDGYIKEHHSGFKEDEDFVVLPNGMVQQKVARPKFLLLANLLQKKNFKGVICLCWDRFSRNASDDVIIKKLIAQGIDVRFAQTTYDKSSSGALHMDIDGAFSRHYSRVISEKVINTTNKLRAEGKCTYRAPIGYFDNGSEQKPFDPERAPLVKEIFQRYATGEWSFATLAQWSGQQGLTTKPFRRHRTETERLAGTGLDTIPKLARPVTGKTIENILKNPFYIGKNRHGNEWIDSIAHQPLIDKGLFLKVQAMLRKKTTSVHYPELTFITYRGLLRCTYCKRSYAPYEQKGIIYYRSKCKPDCPNTAKNINEAFITKKIQAVMNKIAFTADELAEIEKEAFTELNKVTTRRNLELADLYGQLKKAMDDLDYLAKEKLSLLRNQIMTGEQILDEESRLNAFIEDIRARIEANAESSQEMLKYIITFSDLVKNAALYFEHALDTEKRDLATQVFTELFLGDRNLKYTPKQGYDALLARFDSKNCLLGSPSYLFTELTTIYRLVKAEMSALKDTSFLKIVA